MKTILKVFLTKLARNGKGDRTVEIPVEIPMESDEYYEGCELSLDKVKKGKNGSFILKNVHWCGCGDEIIDDRGKEQGLCGMCSIIHDEDWHL